MGSAGGVGTWGCEGAITRPCICGCTFLAPFTFFFAGYKSRLLTCV